MKTKTLLFLAALTSTQAFGWGFIGHRTVAEIAQRQLTPAAKAGVTRLLGAESLVDVANWADTVRANGEYRPTVWYHFEKIPDNVSFLDNIKNMPDWQKLKGGAVSAILVSNYLLRDDASSDRLKTDTLKFLVHFMGDIHQPLHSGPPESKGGVTDIIDWMGTEMSLHRVWDSGMIKTGHADLMSKADPTVAYADFIVGEFKDLKVNSDMNVEGWQNEALAMRPPAFDPIYKTDQPKYQSLHLKEVDERIYLGGMRLGAMLNALFSLQPIPDSQKQLRKDIEAIIGNLDAIVNLNP